MGGPVIFFFSVIKRSVLTYLSAQRISGDNIKQSREFCGVAVMTSEIDYMRTDDFWAEDRRQGYACTEFRGFVMLMQFSEGSASVGFLPQCYPLFASAIYILNHQAPTIGTKM